MDTYLTAATIKALRESAHLTQAALAEKLHISDKTVSKWETGKGYPDITLLEPLAAAFQVSVAELLSGNAVCNSNIAASLLRSHFYVCPVCGNVLYSVGEAALYCHGIALPPLIAEEADEAHHANVTPVEDEYFVCIPHEMTRAHHISFIAALTGDRLQLVKLYPEGNAETRLKMNGVRRIWFYCNRDGLYTQSVR